MEWMLTTMAHICDGKKGEAMEITDVKVVADLLDKCQVTPQVTQAERQAEFNANLANSSMQASKDTGSNLIDAPKIFGAHPTVEPHSKDNARLTLVRNNFVQPKPLFSGGNGDGRHRANIHELLDKLARAQRVCVLSEIEFRDKLLEVFTGTAYQSVADWIDEELPVQEIYTKIMRRFNQDETPDVAQLKLDKLTQSEHSFKTLAEAETEIFRLSKLSARQYEQGDYRVACANISATKAFERVCPEGARNPILAERARMTQFKDRELTFDEIMNIANTYRTMIDETWVKRPKSQKSKDGEDKKKDLKVHAVEAVVPMMAVPANAVGVKAVHSNFSPKTGPGRDSGRMTACSLCPSLAHAAEECNWFQHPKERFVAPRPCKKCDWGKNHLERFCPLNKLRRFEGTAEKQAARKGN